MDNIITTYTDARRRRQRQRRSEYPLSGEIRREDKHRPSDRGKVNK